MHPFEPTSLRASDGVALSSRWWPGRGPGAVLYLHGIQSHGGWFERSAAHLAMQGLGVLLPDRRGSGTNDRGMPSRSVQKRLVSDVCEQVNWLLERTGGRAVYLIGVSWGAKLAVASYSRCHEKVAGMALVGPGLFQKVNVPTSTKARIGLAAAVKPNTTFEIPLNDPMMFTANETMQVYIRDDPLRLRRAPASFFAASRFMDGAKDRLARMPACPLTVFLAGHDPIVDNDRIRHWVRELGWPDRRVIQYDNASHTLEFEPDPSDYLTDLSRAAQAGFNNSVSPKCE
jgi:alpha-beta hydrolase superfamily lysophospholipase